MKKITFILFIFIHAFVFSQSKMDSLRQALKNAKHDTTRLALMVAISEECELNEILQYAEPAVKLANRLLKDGTVSKSSVLIKTRKALALNNIGFINSELGRFKEAQEAFDQSLAIQEELGDKKGIGQVLNNLGSLYRNQGKLNEALDYYGRSLRVEQEIGNKDGISRTLNNIGLIYNQQGQVKEALDYYTRCLKIEEETGNKKGIARCNINIGVLYHNQDQNKEALECYRKSLKMLTEIGDKQGMAFSLLNIGGIIGEDGNLKEELNYYAKSLKLFEEIGDMQGIANILHNTGTIYIKLDQQETALDYFMRSLSIEREINDKKQMAFSYTNIGKVFYNQKKYAVAAAYEDSSLAISKAVGLTENIRNAEDMLTLIESARGNAKKAYEHYKLYILYRDSITNLETKRSTIKKQMSYEFGKKEAVAKLEQEKKDTIDRIIIYSISGGLLLLVLLALYILWGYRQKQKANIIITRQKQEMENQKNLVEEKQKEIIDSIKYARRIQTSLLPTHIYIEKNINSLKK